jgi:START domain
MNIATTGIVAALSLSCFLSGREAAERKDGWVFKKEKDNVKVYTKKMDNGHTAVKLTSSVQAGLSGVALLFSDVDDYIKWGYKMTESKLVHRTSDTELHYYAKFDFPWPLDDRDIVMHSVLTQDAKTKMLHYENNAKPETVAEKKNVVRIKDAKTEWKFFAPKDGWMYLEQYIFSDPGGDIPAWATDFAVDSGPIETIRGIRKRLRDERYQKAKLEHIKE